MTHLVYLQYSIGKSFSQNSLLITILKRVILIYLDLTLTHHSEKVLNINS